jgi:hypothetical protein
MPLGWDGLPGQPFNTLIIVANDRKNIQGWVSRAAAHPDGRFFQREALQITLQVSDSGRKQRLVKLTKDP